MRVLVAAVAVLLAAVAVMGSSNVKQMFESFKLKYNRKYASADEEAKRFAIFAQNMRRAGQHMATNPLAVFGVNEYADMSAEEFKTRHNAEKHYARAVREAANKPKTQFSAEQNAAAQGRAIDWRTKGAVTPIKNQGQCGSCWAFSTTGGIEGQWFLAGNALTSLSEQEFVSCDTIDQGCNGGLMDNAYQWVLQAHNGKIVTEGSYPYVSGNGEVPACSMSGTVFGAQISGYDNIAHDENTMATWVYANGPLSIAVDATSWQTYVSGIMTNCISQQLDHGVLIVGFDDNNNPPYWTIKNSWGVSWGENGYIRVAKGSNQCLLTQYPCSAKVSGGPAPSTPAPSGRQFTQKKCKDPKCSQCASLVFTEGQCITGTKYSYKGYCKDGALLIDAFAGRSCSGSPYTQTKNLVDTCSIDFDTIHTEEFVSNVCHNGPAPTPAPTTAAPPTPSPSGNGTFIQMDCSDSACTQNCQNNTFPAGQCLPLSGGGSAMATCNPGELVMTEYPLSNDCTGISIPSSMPLDQCLQNGDGSGYFENICPGQSVSLLAAKRGANVLSVHKRK